MKKIILSVLILLALAGTAIYFSSSKNKMEMSNLPTQKEMQLEEMSKKKPEMVETASYIDLSPQEAKELIMEMPEVVIIDVSPKYDEGHLPGAINYYVGDGSLDMAIPDLNKDLTYLVYCHVDSASIAGAEKLIKAGFENVYRLEGNYAAWVEAGYEVEE
jgi:rhodanese-related sulfurtransferase